MSKDALAAKSARLQQEIERLAVKHAERLCQQEAPPGGKTRELEARRAEMLEWRMRQLGEMLDVLQRWESEPGSFDTTSHPMAVAQGFKKSAGPS